jgi:hypothetical protein
MSCEAMIKVGRVIPNAPASVSRSWSEGNDFGALGITRPTPTLRSEFLIF